MKANHTKRIKFAGKGVRVAAHGRRFVSLLLCLCMVLSSYFGVMVLPTTAAAEQTESALNRIADGDTTDTYVGKLLSDEWGSRYAGRVWTDKSVFAYDDEKESNVISLDMDTDGYTGDVGFNADFAHVFSALGSSQVINEPSPMDVMFVIDVSGSMGQYISNTETGQKLPLPKEKFEEAPISKLVTSVNSAISQLLETSPDSRFGIAIYGSTAAVLVPLGHYEKSSTVLSTDYLESYSTQGLHFTLNATVQEAGKEPVTYYSDNSGLTSNEAHGVDATGNGNRVYGGTGGQTTGNGKTPETAFHVGHITNPQAGFAAAMDQFITNNYERTWQSSSGRDILRIPAMIHLTDGQASDLAWIQPTISEETDAYAWEKIISNWNNVNWEYDLAYNSQNGGTNLNTKWNASQLTGAGDAAPVIFQTLMTAAYYKSAVEAYYTASGASDASGNPASLLCYSIYASDTSEYNMITDHQIKATIDAILDPAANFQDSDGEATDSSVLDSSSAPEAFIDTAYELYKLWYNGGNYNMTVQPTFSRKTTSSGESLNDINISISVGDAVTGSKYADEDWFNGTVTNETVNKNIAYLPSDNFKKTDFGSLGSVFGSIIDDLFGKAFIPIAGNNSANVGDSITYQDPLGEYMEIKDGAITATPLHLGEAPMPEATYDMSLLVFGEMHGLVRVGVYDYQWNDQYMKEHPAAGEHGVNPFPMGWYWGDDPKTAVKAGEDNTGKDDAGSYPLHSVEDTSKTYKNANEARADGWVFRVDFKTLIQFVPIVDAPESGLPQDLSQQVMNTKYTLYRFAGSTDERNALRRNPIYGEVPSDLQATWNTYKGGAYPDTDALYADTPGVYRLSDIRVWVEDTGDFTDTSGAIAPNTGYDRSLYVNIPVAAIPTQLATITLGPDGVTAYQTNLGSDHLSGTGEGTENYVSYNAYCYQSTPFRLFYAVGLEDDLILRDALGNQVGVDLNTVSPEYIQTHTNAENDNVWFISNYYSETRYNGYTTDDVSRTRGDPTVTFSPNIDNRYYVFQKPLPLYAHAYRVSADGTGVSVDNTGGAIWRDNSSGNGTTTWEDGSVGGASWTGGQFMGIYDSQAAFQAAYQKYLESGDGTITDSHGSVYEFVPGGIIFSEEDLLDHVTSTADGSYTAESHSFSSEDYYFILLEFYVPTGGTGTDKDGNPIDGSQEGKFVQYALTRRGSEFGSGYASSNISNGAMLCWTDMNGDIDTNFTYMSASDTGDRTRGEPTWEKLTLTDEPLRTYLKDCGITDVDAQYEYWTGVQANPQVQAALRKADTNGDSGVDADEFKTYFRFALAARPGGIRSGDMSNNLQYKGTYNAATGYYSENRTKTSNTYYLPTISNNSGTDNNVIINNFLGNNGRLEIANQTLHVTKMIEPPEGFTLTDEQKQDEVFNYQVSIQGVTGTRTAVKTEYNEYAESWERQLGYIDVLTDNSDLVQTNDSTRALFVKVTGTTSIGTDSVMAKQVLLNETTGRYYYANENGALPTDADGNADETQEVPADVINGGENLYYMYLPSNGTTDTGTEHVHRLYQAEDYDGADKITEGLGRNGITTFVRQGDPITPSESGEENRNSKRTADATHSAGTKTYWNLDAELIPKSVVDEAEAIDLPMGSPADPGGFAIIAFEADAPSTWTHDDGAHAGENHVELTYHDFFVRRPVKETSASEFTSPYKSRTQYMTVTLNFGLNANNDGSGTPGDPLAEADLYDKGTFGTVTTIERLLQITAEFTLRHGEGLMFSGLSGSPYRFSEKLTDGQKSVGYTLKEVVQSQQSGLVLYPGYDLRFADTNGVYSVDGDTGDSEEQVHYTNTVDPELFVLTKVMEDKGGNPVATPPDQEFTFTLTFTPDAGAAMTDMDDVLHYWKGDKDTWTSTETWTDEDDGKTYKMPENAPPLDGYETYLTGEPYRLKPIRPDAGKTTRTYTVKLKANEAIVFYGLIAGMTYSVEEAANENYPIVPDKGDGVSADGYTKSGTIYRASVSAEEISPRTTHNRAEFTNLLQNGSLTVEKNILDDNCWSLTEDFGFTVELTAGEGIPLKAEDLSVTKFTTKEDGTECSEELPNTWTTETADGETRLTATFRLKHGERFVINGIPLGTKYTVKESDRNGYNLEYVVDVIETPDTSNSDNFIHPKDFTTEGDITEKQPQAYWLFVNAKPPVLAFTGGNGVGLFYALGAVCLLISVLALVCLRKRRSA